MIKPNLLDYAIAGVLGAVSVVPFTQSLDKAWTLLEEAKNNDLEIVVETSLGFDYTVTINSSDDTKSDTPCSIVTNSEELCVAICKAWLEWKGVNGIDYA